MFICRVCLEHSDKLISLKSDRIDALPILHMLSEFTIMNTEQQLPKYICENCTNDLDIAYAFKRKYEDSIVKFIRRTSYQDETTKIEEDSHCKMYSELEDQFEGEQQETMPTRTEDVHPYTAVNHSNVVHEIDIEEMDVKLFLKSTSFDKPHPAAVELLNDDESINRTHEEMPGRSNLTKHRNGTSSVGSVSQEIPEPVPVEKPSSILHSNCDEDINLQGTTSLQALHPDLCKSSTTKDETSCLPHANASHIEQTSDVKENYLNCVQSQDLSSEMSSECKEVEEVHFRCLRSNAQGIESQVSLTQEILNKIYRNHGSSRGMKPYRCDVCFRWFKTKGHIKVHRLRHIEGEKKIKCRKCLSTFLTKPHLRNHKCL